jgi:hypothetical protein
MGERSENAAPRKKRRVRWLILALLLVLASGVAWWEWPRGDARFVGKWALTSVDGHSVGRLNQIDFRSNGNAVFSRATDRSAPFPWSAQASTLTFGEPKRTLLNWRLTASLWAKFLLSVSNADAFFWDERTYDVVEQTSSTLKLRDKRSCEYEFRRISE